MTPEQRIHDAYARACFRMGAFAARFGKSEEECPCPAWTYWADCWHDGYAYELQRGAR